MPVRLSLGGKEIQAAWGTDAMVAPERQRRGLGEELFRTWDRSVGAALGLGLSESSSALLKKMHFPDVAIDSRCRQAADAPRGAHAAVADGAQSHRLSGDASDRPRRRARSAAPRRRRANPPLRRLIHRSVGKGRRSLRARRAPRRRLLELEVHRAAARAVLRRCAQARGTSPKGTRCTATRRSRAAASRCSSTSSPTRTTRSVSRRCSDGSMPRRARPGPTRSAATRHTWGSAASCGIRDIFRCGRSRWRWQPRSTP